ncbi:MAG: SUF system Fe-S cluster assembly protein [Methylococcales bacterium]|jgi:FeS assembly SUF system protein|nr:SUF system Fe-S cluster assembly protein [Methylococcales bacterium]MBT7410282.1 SUF system Fe-S cluster assembly protein [Methylococcales bacterium]
MNDLTPDDIDNKLIDQVVDVLKTVFDPEIPVNIFDLGLIYKIDLGDNNSILIDMTLTAPGCPVAQTFPGTVENAVKSLDWVSDVSVELVWEPPWTMDRMTEAAKLELGMM